MCYNKEIKRTITVCKFVSNKSSKCSSEEYKYRWKIDWQVASHKSEIGTCNNNAGSGGTRPISIWRENDIHGDGISNFISNVNYAWRARIETNVIWTAHAISESCLRVHPNQAYQFVSNSSQVKPKPPLVFCCQHKVNCQLKSENFNPEIYWYRIDYILITSSDKFSTFYKGNKSMKADGMKIWLVTKALKRLKIIRGVHQVTFACSA